MTDFDPKKPLRTIEGHIKFRVIWQDKTGLLLEKKEGGSRMWVGELWAQQHLENIPELSQKPRQWTLVAEKGKEAIRIAGFSGWFVSTETEIPVIELTPAVRAALEKDGLLP